MRRLRIAIDPVLAASHGPEVCWAWRTLLVGMGFAWQEVDPSDPSCDVAYVIGPRVTSAKVTILANEGRWKAPGVPWLAGVARAGPFACPRFTGEPASAPLAYQDGRVICERDIVFDVFWLATGQQEPMWPKGDHGIFDLDAEPIVTEGVLRRALASEIGQTLERLLAELGVASPEPRWPGSKRAAACVGHDVDYPEVVRSVEPLRILARQGLGGMANAWAVATGRRHHWHFGSWLNLEESMGCRSAFYFCARPGSLLRRALGTPDPFYDIRLPRFRDLFRELKDRGAEIGLHASYRAYQDFEQLAREKRVLEEAAGVAVLGNRHHYWHLNPDNPEETLRFHERAGFAYDCSLAHDRYVGWRRGFTWPFFPFDSEQRRPLATLQLPAGWMDDQLFGLSRHNPGERTSIIDELIARVVDQRGCLVVDVHEYVFDPALFPGWADTYRYALEALAARRDIWLAIPADLARHWTNRARRLEDASHGLNEHRWVAAGVAQSAR
jgi:hypothetical protein